MGFPGCQWLSIGALGVGAERGTIGEDISYQYLSIGYLWISFMKIL